ncbi:MAG: TRAP transporter small permease [Rhodospirillaceae bacterium]|nr:TRAP transporter small permease [Rhodospirillaceae bacterium]
MTSGLHIGLKRFAELVAAAAFAAMFGAFMIQIVSRYVFNMPVSWSLEICSIAYIWIVFWTCDLLVSERQHIIFDVLYLKFPPNWRRLVGIFNTASLGMVFLAGLWVTLDYIFTQTRRTMILYVPLNIVYACFGVFMIAVIVGAALRLRKLFGASWQQHL